MNPLVNLSGLPPFSKIKPEHVKPALEQALAECRKIIDDIVALDEPYTWDNLVMPLDDKDDAWDRLWSPVSHLNSVCSSDELREAYESCLPMISEYCTFCGQHEGLYNAYKALREGPNYDGLSVEQKKVIDDTLRDFKLSGIGLSDDKKKRYGEIAARQSELASKFANNVLDATNAWQKVITDEGQLAGLPESAVAAAKEMAEAKGEQGWLFTLDFPSYFPVMSHADSRELREEMYTAYVTRASEKGPNAGEFDNSDVMVEKLKLRQEGARLLDFANYGEESLATKMAENNEQVFEFLNQLADKSQNQAKADFAELEAFAKAEHSVTDLKAWDLSYYTEKLQQHKYAISAEQLRPYFPEEKVIAGLFETVKRLFGIEVKHREGVDVWHENVRFYDIFDSEGTLRGSFYFDLYAREQKRGGAWMDGCISRRVTSDGELQLPVAYLTCNFNKPVGGKPALFTHDEVVTLFHEFGHGLHHMLTKGVTSGGVVASTVWHGMRWNCPASSSKTGVGKPKLWRICLATMKLASHCRRNCSTRCWRPRTSSRR